MAIDKKLIHFKTKENFMSANGVNGNDTTPSSGSEAEGNAEYGQIKGTSIVFIKDSNEIWTHGAYFGNVNNGYICDLRNVEIMGHSEENDIYTYIITEENSQSVFGTSISELYNALLPKGEENESGETVISDWNLNEIPVILITPEGYLLNPTTYMFGDDIVILYEPISAMTEGYSRAWQIQIAENSVYIANMPSPQKSYIKFTIPDSYILGETLILNESDIETACGLSYNQLKVYGTMRPIELNVLEYSILECSRYVSNINFVAPGAGFVLIADDENKTITLNSSYDWGYLFSSSLKTINGESIVGEGDITIEGGNVQAVDTGDVIDDVTIEYATKTYVDGLVGDINSVLESIING